MFMTLARIHIDALAKEQDALEQQQAALDVTMETQTQGIHRLEEKTRQLEESRDLEVRVQSIEGSSTNHLGKTGKVKGTTGRFRWGITSNGRYDS